MTGIPVSFPVSILSAFRSNLSYCLFLYLMQFFAAFSENLMDASAFASHIFSLSNPFLSKEDVDSVAASEDYEPSERNASNLCGYIVYSVKDSKGIFKKDLFTIPLGKRSIK